MLNKAQRKGKKNMKILFSNGFQEPLQILADTEFLKQTRNYSNIYKLVRNILPGNFFFFTTECMYRKLDKGIKGFVGECKIINCGHDENDPNCLEKMFIKNKEINANAKSRKDDEILSMDSGSLKDMNESADSNERISQNKTKEKTMELKNKNHYLVATGKTLRIRIFKNSGIIPVIRARKNQLFLDLGEMQMKKKSYSLEPASKSEIERLRKLIEKDSNGSESSEDHKE